MIARDGCILRTVVGSQVHGLNNPGTDDRDEMAIFIEDASTATGLGPGLEHWVYRTQPEGEPSGPGDLDLVAYSLRRYCQLAIKGSPTVLLPLFAPEEHVLICTDVGRTLRDLAPSFVSEKTRQSFVGYLTAQRRALLEKPAREREASIEHGYDTKYAMHALRIGYQGIELLTDQNITLPVPEPQRSRLMAVRAGTVPRAEITEELDSLTAQLELVPMVHITPEPELGIDQWLTETYLEYWNETWRPLPLM